MTESEARKKIVSTIASWIGRKESDGSHKYIIDIYNRQSKLPRGYRVQYTDAWCATTVTAAYFACGLIDAITPECSCYYMTEGFKKNGRWIESDYYEPKSGDIVMYSYSGEKADYKNTDNVGTPEHTGIVEKYSDGIITVIEGNSADSVRRVYLEKNGKYIRGYGIPRFAAAASDDTQTNTSDTQTDTSDTVKIDAPVLSYGSEGNDVVLLQIILDGYRLSPGPIDGEFGTKTEKALKTYQLSKGLTQSGKTDLATWKAFLGT